MTFIRSMMLHNFECRFFNRNNNARLRPAYRFLKFVRLQLIFVRLEEVLFHHSLASSTVLQHLNLLTGVTTSFFKTRYIAMYIRCRIRSYGERRNFDRNACVKRYVNSYNAQMRHSDHHGIRPRRATTKIDAARRINLAVPTGCKYRKQLVPFAFTCPMVVHGVLPTQPKVDLRDRVPTHTSITVTLTFDDLSLMYTLRRKRGKSGP